MKAAVIPQENTRRKVTLIQQCESIKDKKKRCHNILSYIILPAVTTFKTTKDSASSRIAGTILRLVLVTCSMYTKYRTVIAVTPTHMYAQISYLLPKKY